MFFYLNATFDILKKFKQNICTYAFTYYVRTKSFYEKSTCRLIYINKIKFSAKIWHLRYMFYPFLHQPNEMSGFCETLGTHGL
jgi:hypothetical protein